MRSSSTGGLSRLFIFLLVLFFLPIVHGARSDAPISNYITFTIDDVYINETFNYTNSYDSHGWAYTESDSGGCVGSSPTATGFDFNVSSCASSGWRQISRNFGNNVSLLSTAIMVVKVRQNDTGLTNWLRLGDVENGLQRNLKINDDIQVLLQSGGKQIVNTSTGLSDDLDDITEIVFVMHNDRETVDIYVNGVQTNSEDPGWASLGIINYIDVYHVFGTGGFYRSIEELYFFNGTVVGVNPASDCDYPVLFCDDFNYATPLSTAGWTVENYDKSYNTVFSPVNSSYVRWNQTNPFSFYHWIDSFDVEYTIPSGFTITSTVFAPSFSNEFRFNFTDSDEGIIELKGFDAFGTECVRLEIEDKDASNVQLKYYNLSSGAYDVLNDTITTDEWHDLKLISKFSSTQNNMTYTYGFNTTYDHHRFEVYLDGHQAGDLSHIDMPANCVSIYSFHFIQESTDSIINIDDYYMYAGSDKVTDTTPNELIELLEELTSEDALTSDLGIEDLGGTVTGFWDDVGLITTTSKIIAGILILFTVLITSIGLIVMSKVPISGGIIGLLLFMGVITAFGLVFVGLFPYWIAIVLSFFGIGILLLGFKIANQN